MGLIGFLRSFTRASRNGSFVDDVKIDAGGQDNITAEDFRPSGDDSQPLPGDYPFYVGGVGNGRGAILGYVDPKNQGVADKGEKRIYARNSSGAVVCEAHFKKDGSYKIFNSIGFTEMGADGTANTNGVTIDKDGNMNVPNSLILNGREINLHDHNETGSVTGPNNG